MVVPAELKDVLISWQRWALGLEGLGFNQVARCAIGHRLVESGHSVLFAPAYRLVQDLLAAKRDLALPRHRNTSCQWWLPLNRDNANAPLTPDKASQLWLWTSWTLPGCSTSFSGVREAKPDVMARTRYRPKARQAT